MGMRRQTETIDEKRIAEILGSSDVAVSVGLESKDGVPDRELRQFVRRVLRRSDGDGVDVDSGEGDGGAALAEGAEEHDGSVGSVEEKRRDAEDAKAALAARVSVVLESLVARGVLQKFDQN